MISARCLARGYLFVSRKFFKAKVNAGPTVLEKAEINRHEGTITFTNKLAYESFRDHSL